MAKKTRKKKAASRPKASKRASRDRYAHIESEIVRIIIGPRIRDLWSQGNQTPSSLRGAYNAIYTAGHGDISEAAFKDWLRLCGFTRQPSTLSAPSGAQLGVEPAPRPAPRNSPPPGLTEDLEPEVHRNGVSRIDSLLRHDGDLDDPAADGEAPQPMLTPPPETMPGDPGYVLSNPNA